MGLFTLLSIEGDAGGNRRALGGAVGIKQPDIIAHNRSRSRRYGAYKWFTVFMAALRFPERAAIALYPNCAGDLASNTAPLLVLIGAKADWTPADLCHDLDQTPRGAHAADVAFYASAEHCFDVPGCNKIHMGHRVKYDKPAAEDAQARVKACWAQYLR